MVIPEKVLHGSPISPARRASPAQDEPRKQDPSSEPNIPESKHKVRSSSDKSSKKSSSRSSSSHSSKSSHSDKDKRHDPNLILKNKNDLQVNAPVKVDL